MELMVSSQGTSIDDFAGQWPGDANWAGIDMFRLDDDGKIVDRHDCSEQNMSDHDRYDTTRSSPSAGPAAFRELATCDGGRKTDDDEDSGEPGRDDVSHGDRSDYA